jgi:hypothetical protein
MENPSVANLSKKADVIFKLFKMLRAMIAFEPVLINLIAIGLGCGVLLLLSHPALFPKMGKYHLWLTYAIYVLITVQTIRSAAKSLFIPFLALMLSGIGYLCLSLYPDWHFISTAILKQLMLLSVIGIATAIFAIK